MVLELHPKRDKVWVALDMDTVFLHPASVTPGQPSDDPILTGTVTVDLAAARKVSKIRVQLKGVTTMHGGGDYRYETSVTLLKLLEIDLGGEKLPKGQHSYHFSFIIPSTAAVQERSKFGMVRHTVRATVTGLGAFGTPVHSPFTPVWLIANPAPHGELPQGIEIIVQDFGAEVGPLAFNISSPHLIVASLLFLNISLLAPPAMVIMSVTGYILQQFSIIYDDDAGVVSPPPQKKILFYVDQTMRDTESSTDNLIERGNIGLGATFPQAYESRRLNPKPFAELPAGKPWSYSRIARIPDDDNCRPSTLEATDTKIRVKHKIVADVKYRLVGSKKDMMLSMSTDAVIASCCCLTDSLLLPSYARVTPPSTPIRPFHRRCLCNQSLREMVEKHGAELTSAEVRPQPVGPASVLVPKLGMEGEHLLGAHRNSMSTPRDNSSLPQTHVIIV